MIYCQPFTGENIYSILSRAHLRSVSNSPLETLRNFTGVRGYKPLSGLPTHINRLSRNLTTTLSAPDLVTFHTHFPLYQHFLSESRRELVLDAMFYDGSPKARLGLLRNDVGASESRVFCVDCVRSDTENFGVSYWHREHNVPGVGVCPHHARPLCEKHGERPYGGRELYLPERTCATPPKHNGLVEERLRFIAFNIYALLNTKSSREINAATYLKLLKELGLATSSNRIRLRELTRIIKDWLEPLSEFTAFSRLYKNLDLQRTWPSCLMETNSGFHHPLKHLVLWGSLGLELSDVLIAAQEVGEQLELPFGRDVKALLSRDLIHELYKSSGSYSKIAEQLNVDVSTLLAVAEAEGCLTKRKPKKISEETKIAIRGEPGNSSASQLARKYDVSLSSIYRIRRKTGLHVDQHLLEEIINSSRQKD